jgi:hypothetical protein
MTDIEALRGAWLVLGGSQFMGRHIVSSLLDLSADVSVTMLNRGITPCPFSKDVTRPCRTGACNGQSRLTHLHCDRLNERAIFREHLLSVRTGARAAYFVSRWLGPITCLHRQRSKLGVGLLLST